MRRLLLIPLLTLLGCSAFAQPREELYAIFPDATNSADTVSIAAVMADWEKLYPDDAELYSIRANYHYLSSREENIVLAAEVPADGRECMEVMDSLGVKGYMYSEIQIDSAKYSEAIMTLTEGISKHPDRLDLRLGKVTLLLLDNENDLVNEEITSALEQSLKNQNNWCETLDVPVETEGVAYLRDCIQDYFKHFIDNGDFGSAEKMIDACLEAYPVDVVFLNDKGSVDSMQMTSRARWSGSVRHMKYIRKICSLSPTLLSYLSCKATPTTHLSIIPSWRNQMMRSFRS